MTLQPRAAALAVLAASSSSAASACALAAPPETVAVERALDGDTVLLDDGRAIRLAGVAAPKAPLGVEAASWPAGETARAALDGLAAGRVLEMRASRRSPDRHGRITAYFGEIDGSEHAAIAVALLGRGLVRRAADGAGRDCEATLAAAEAPAAGARLGLWSEGYYAVLDASDGAALSSSAGRFIVAEGRVASIGSSAGRTYVNFGERWREALSLSVTEAKLRELGGLNALGARVGAKLRVRGVVDARRGPTIQLVEAAQVDRLDGRKE